MNATLDSLLHQEDLLERTRKLCSTLASAPGRSNAAPLAALDELRAAGLLVAPLRPRFGGTGLGLDPGTHATALQVLSTLGSADLALGRIFEGHLNALILVQRFGTPDQVLRFAEEVHAGALFAVWNTGTADPLKLVPHHAEGFCFDGTKTFATGARFAQRAIITAELPGKGGWQMCCPRLDVLPLRIDYDSWHPLGMEASESFTIDFTGAVVPSQDLIGPPGAFYTDPLFQGGAIRFAAVQTGAALRLESLLAAWLRQTRALENPWQLARLADVSMLAQQLRLWLDWAAATAEECLFSVDPVRSSRMVSCANMMRLSVEDACTRIMQLVTVGVGARGLMQPHPFEQILRDLTMYLRQPAPDQVRAAVGRAALARSSPE